MPLSNTKSTAGTLSSPLSFLPVDGLLVLLQILKNIHTPTYASLKRPHHTLNSLLLLTVSNRTTGGLALLSVSLLHTQKLIDSVLAKGLLIFIEIVEDSLTKAV